MQLRDTVPAWLRVPRRCNWLVLALALIAVIAAQKFGLPIYKASRVSLAAVMAYWLDRALLP